MPRPSTRILSPQALADGPEDTRNVAKKRREGRRFRIAPPPAWNLVRVQNSRMRHLAYPQLEAIATQYFDWHFQPSLGCLMHGRTPGHSCITELIGAGGMGVVYLACDRNCTGLAGDVSGCEFLVGTPAVFFHITPTKTGTRYNFSQPNGGGRP